MFVFDKQKTFMKKIIIVATLALVFITNTSNAQDKAFKKGDITVDLGIGFGIYGTKIHQKFGNFTKDTTDAAASAIYPLKAEYGITNWLGIGARFAFSNYAEERDSITGIKPTSRGIDAAIVANFHLVKSKRFDMPISLTFGYSKFSILSNDNFGTKAKANGLGYGISLLPRIYFGNHIGMFFNIGYMGYNYPNIKYSNNNDSDLNKTWNAKVSLKANGLNMGIGLIGKF